MVTAHHHAESERVASVRLVHDAARDKNDDRRAIADIARRRFETRAGRLMTSKRDAGDKPDANRRLPRKRPKVVLPVQDKGSFASLLGPSDRSKVDPR
jgi:hypothetical protein